MSDLIEKYYKEINTPPILLKQKMVKLESNYDVKKEFEYWIESGKYKDDNCLTVEGYTAKKLSEISPYLNGEGAFMMLIELKNDPIAAKLKIEKGFKIK